MLQYVLVGLIFAAVCTRRFLIVATTVNGTGVQLKSTLQRECCGINILTRNIKLRHSVVEVLYTNIDQTLMNSLHGLLNCGIGGLVCHVITTENITRVHCIHM